MGVSFLFWQIRARAPFPRSVRLQTPLDSC
jgi:hypothetical protein